MKTLLQIETEIAAVIADPNTSYWLKIQLRTRLNRDPLNYAADAKALCDILDERARAVPEEDRAFTIN
jgi:hypothetical protein